MGKPKMGETALYGADSSILIAMMSKEILCMHAEVLGLMTFWTTWSFINWMIGKDVYQAAIENALTEHESQHMINWIEGEVAKELAQLDQDEQIRACVEQLKSL